MKKFKHTVKVEGFYSECLTMPITCTYLCHRLCLCIHLIYLPFLSCLFISKIRKAHNACSLLLDGSGG